MIFLIIGPHFGGCFLPGVSNLLHGTCCFCKKPSQGQEIEISKAAPNHQEMERQRMILLMEEILHHLGCIKPC